STRSPERSGVSAQAARGTTSPLTATAMPRWATSTAFSSSKAASVAAVTTSSWPLGRIRATTGAWLMTRKLFRSARQRKSIDAERPDGQIDGTFEHKSRDHVGCDRSEQNAVAMMAGGVDEPVNLPPTEDRRIVAAAGAMADPHFFDR